MSQINHNLQWSWPIKMKDTKIPNSFRFLGISNQETPDDVCETFGRVRFCSQTDLLRQEITEFVDNTWK